MPHRTPSIFDRLRAFPRRFHATKCGFNRRVSNHVSRCNQGTIIALFLTVSRDAALATPKTRQANSTDRSYQSFEPAGMPIL
jgi:hypothetical protein